MQIGTLDSLLPAKDVSAEGKIRCANSGGWGRDPAPGEIKSCFCMSAENQKSYLDEFVKKDKRKVSSFTPPK